MSYQSQSHDRHDLSPRDAPPSSFNNKSRRAPAEYPHSGHPYSSPQLFSGLSSAPPSLSGRPTHAPSASSATEDCPRGVLRDAQASQSVSHSSRMLSVNENSLFKARSTPDLPNPPPKGPRPPPTRTTRREHSGHHSSSQSMSAGSTSGDDVFWRSRPTFVYPSSKSDFSPSTPAFRASSRKASGNTSDSSAHYHSTSALDMKRLLSKPAVPVSPGGSSALSGPSDSEASHARPRPQQQRLASRAQPPQRPRSSSHALDHVEDAGWRIDWQDARREAESRILTTPVSADAKPVVPRGTREAEREKERVKERVARRRLSDGPSPMTPSFKPLSGKPPKSSAKPVDSGPSSSGKYRSSSPAHSLTPAMQVAVAYLEQERRHAALVQASGADDPPTSSHSAYGSKSSRLNATSDSTAFASTYTSQPAQAAANADANQPLRHKVSRKASFKRKKEADDVAVKDNDIEDEKELVNAQPRRSFSLPTTMSKGKAQALRLSIDDYVSVHKESIDVTQMVSLDGTKRWGSNHKHPFSPEKMKRREEASPTTKLWKLVKRISSGTLKDRFKGPQENAPPVPAIPDHLLTSPGSYIGLDQDDEEDSQNRKPYTDLSSNPVTPPSTSPLPGSNRMSSPISHRLRVDTITTTNSTVTSSTTSLFVRPRAATNTSSPLSPDAIPSPNMPMGQSARSSVSSYGELVTYPPKPYVGQHIIPPEELSRLDREDAFSSSSPHTPSSGSRLGTPDKEFARFGEPAIVSLPFPRRRAATNGSLQKDRSIDTPPDSPPIPLFTTELCVNNFPTRASFQRDQESSPQQQNGTTLPPLTPRYTTTISSSSESARLVSSTSSSGTPPPPRPPRSNERPKALSLNTTPSPPLSLLPSSARSEWFDDELAEDTSSGPKKKRSSGGTISQASTARERERERDRDAERRHTPTSTSLTSPSSGSSTSPMTVSPVTFREFKEPRPVWSDKEKADKWDDLLERSARAGGTLHLGLGGLMSDSMRDSLAETLTVYSDS